jgi:hypothetical protein
MIPVLVTSVRCVSRKDQVSIEDPISRSTSCMATCRESCRESYRAAMANSAVFMQRWPSDWAMPRQGTRLQLDDQL